MVKSETPSTQKGHAVRLGLRENWQQFTLLVVINAFVGGMIGLERTILPELAQAEFGIAAKTAILSFIVVFGITKAITNYYTGALANRLGRKNLLLLGWALALPIPLLLIYAPNWQWVIAANVLLGIHQGLCWSSTVVMKMDLVGDKDRGLAMGLNEAAGYLAVGAVAFATGWIASEYGLRPYPFYIGIALSVAGLLATLIWVKDTLRHVAAEAGQSGIAQQKSVFWETTWRNPKLGAVTQAGLVNNLNDGMVWGLLPMLLAAKHFTLAQTGVIVSIYPAVWGLGQLATGKLADVFDKRKMLTWGMALQGLALLLFIPAKTNGQFIALSALLGLGTAVVYPTFLAAIAGLAHPQQRAESIGVFRLWRDLGYAIGALLTGIIADSLGLEWSVAVIGGLTVASAGVVWTRMK
ncbi:MAG: MFS transporter [Bacteroidetes bacterium]|nr:MFS transporter [Bacteroidota bacterium]